ncbi:hypothetical protein [Caenispirillum bisanense]|uniref:DUF4013 domain-containing protein n=1 Tax=Caenispirillum bisanense TaxID=414052 RepID=A0A286G9Z5_9PROT|nr:hypothetical protein [Caenispirillum bisanense]SOD92330.1 hypothetical protein SAMN05421508_102380 [Caenispirillum bisanense]
MQLPVVETVAEAYHAVWRHRRALAHLAAVPIAAVLVVGIGEHLLTDGPSTDLPTTGGDGEGVGEGAGTDEGGAPAGGGPGLLGIAYLLASLPFLMSWYRLIVEGPQAVAGRPPIAFGRLEGRFLLWVVLLGLVLAVPMVIAGTLAIPFMAGDVSGHELPILPLLLAVFFFLLLVLASLRLSLIFPAVAVEEPASFPRAWEMTKGNSFRIAVAAVLVHVPAILFGGILELAALRLGLPFSLMLAVDLVISFTIMALGAAMFGEAYRRLR